MYILVASFVILCTLFSHLGCILSSRNDLTLQRYEQKLVSGEKVRLL